MVCAGKFVPAKVGALDQLYSDDVLTAPGE